MQHFEKNLAVISLSVCALRRCLSLFVDERRQTRSAANAHTHTQTEWAYYLIPVLALLEHIKSMKLDFMRIIKLSGSNQFKMQLTNDEK